ncbi:MAG TPA: hypothetical protein VFO01_04125, partial [Trebonia sp.]|nr:hypothetical protein [Trebonia sp.]
MASGARQDAADLRAAGAGPRGGIYLLGGALFPLGVALLVIGLMLEAGATGAVKAIKVSAKLLAGR